MITDSEIKQKGVEALILAMGEVEAERFITLIMREPFDYTLWQRKLWEQRSVEEINEQAMKYRTEHKTS